MKKSEITLKETADMLISVAQKMIESKDILTQADKAIGDGDHGIGMARGFEAVEKKIKEGTFNSIGDLLNIIGTTLLTTIGGASGAIFGTFFKGGAKNLGNTKIFDSKALSSMLSDGLEAVKQRGKAKLGDKTMVDALEPAGLKSKETSKRTLQEALEAVSQASRLGMEKTKDMVATLGKAKTLGERSLGYPDPGAISLHLIIKFMAEFLLSESLTR